MFKHIDRLLMASYLKSYVVFLVSLLSLYVVIDLFTNLDDFTQHTHGFVSVTQHIVAYYGYRVAKIFDQLCEPIILLAAMFTVAWMQRNNQLLPLLSAGVSTRRVVAPVLVSACAMLSLSVLNQELIVPRLGEELVRDRDDAVGDKEIEVRGAYEPNGIHIEGRAAVRRERLVRDFSCLLPENLAGTLLPINAREARYVPPGGGPRSGGWLLTGTEPADLGERWNNPGVLEVIDPGKFFLHTREVDFQALTRNRNWFHFASTLQLREELQHPDSQRLAPMAVLFHMRLTRPILGMILVLLGLSVILRDQNRNVFISAAICLVICAVFFAACFTCKALGDREYISPALAAWLPVLSFGPLGVTLFDAVHT